MSYDSDGSKTEFAASFAASQKDRQSESKGDLSNLEVCQPRQIRTQDSRDDEIQEETPSARLQASADFDLLSP